MNNKCGRYYFKDMIQRLKLRGQTNEQIADVLGCSISTVKYCVRMSEPANTKPELSEFGEPQAEYLRVAAVNGCKEFLTVRGWQVGESDPKCKYDVFAHKDKTVRIQVRSTTKTSARGWPMFSTSRLKFNTKECKRVVFEVGDFDYWFFYAYNGDSWMVPFAEVGNRSSVSMEGYDRYSIEDLAVCSSGR